MNISQHSMIYSNRRLSDEAGAYESLLEGMQIRTRACPRKLLLIKGIAISPCITVREFEWSEIPPGLRGGVGLRLAVIMTLAAIAGVFFKSPSWSACRKPPCRKFENTVMYIHSRHYKAAVCDLPGMSARIASTGRSTASALRLRSWFSTIHITSPVRTAK